jgi:hypothetical protein
MDCCTDGLLGATRARKDTFRPSTTAARCSARLLGALLQGSRRPDLLCEGQKADAEATSRAARREKRVMLIERRPSGETMRCRARKWIRKCCITHPATPSTSCVCQLPRSSSAPLRSYSHLQRSPTHHFIPTPCPSLGCAHPLLRAGVVEVTQRNDDVTHSKSAIIIIIIIMIMIIIIMLTRQATRMDLSAAPDSADPSAMAVRLQPPY